MDITLPLLITGTPLTHSHSSSMMSTPQRLQQARLTVASLNVSVCADLLTSALISINAALCLPAHKPITCACVPPSVCVCVVSTGKPESVKFLICVILWACEDFVLSALDRLSQDVERCGSEGCRPG